MREIVDVHCHILPGVDDGPKTMEESLALLREAAFRQGITAMIATPHFHPGRYLVESRQVLAGVHQLRRVLREAEIPLKVFPGQECYWYTGLLEELRRGRVLTMNGTRFVLVEFEPDAIYSVIYGAVRSLTDAGYIPIVAHFERYGCLRERDERLDELRGQGARLQMNFDRLLDKDRFFHKNPWRRLFQAGTVDFLGSDTHGMDFRPLHVKEAVRWLEKEGDRRQVSRVLKTSPSLLFRQS